MLVFCSLFSFPSFGQEPTLDFPDFPRSPKVTCTQYTEPESTVDIWDWRIPRFEFNYKPGNSNPSILEVDSPFHNEEGFSFYPNTAHFVYHPGEPNDYQVLDGWELLYRNFGTATEVVGEPSFGLYNRYDARVRIFFYIEPNGESPYQNARITAKHHIVQGGFTNVSALFEHLNIPANALTEFDKSGLKVSQLNEVIINGTWMYLEFVAAYDPCVCLYPSAISVKPVLSNISDVSFSLDGAGTSTAVYSSSSSPSFLSSFARTALGFINGGAGALVAGFKTFKGLNEPPSGMNGITGVLASKLPNSLLPEAGFTGNILSFLIGGGKSSASSSLMGFNQDFYFQAEGEITTYAGYDPLLLYTPGSYYDQNTPSANRPVYDNPLGVVAILEPPVVERSYERKGNYSQTGEYDVDTYISYRFKGDLKYAINSIAGLSDMPIRIMGALVFNHCEETDYSNAGDYFYNTPVINIKCLEDYITDGFTNETAYYEGANGGPLVYESQGQGCIDIPELQIMAVLENSLHPSADDILFSARYKVDIVTADYDYEDRPENPYAGMSAEEIFDICDPAPPVPVTNEVDLEKFCRNKYDPEVKSLKGEEGVRTAPTEAYDNRVEILETGIYPNPFSSYFVFQIQEKWLNQKTSIQLQDAYGRVVWVKDFYFESAGHLQINQGISALPTGQYYMQLIGENYITSFKLQKQ